MVATAVQEIVRVTLSPELVAHFDALACITGKPIEQEIAEHIERTRTIAPDGLYLSADEASAIRQLLGGGVSTGARLLDMIKRMLAVKTVDRDGKLIRKIVLTPARQEAIYWWCRNSGMPEERAFEMLMDQALGLLLKC